MSNAFKSKTIWLGLLLAVLAAVNLFLEANLSAATYSVIGGLLSMAIVWVRTKTDKPLSEK